jgi:serine protease
VSGVVESDLEHAAALLRLQPEVEYAHPNYLLRLHSSPNDPQYSRQWNMEQINMPAAWDINVGAGSGVTVAVIDSGLTDVEGVYSVRLPIPPSFFFVVPLPVPFLRPPDFAFERVSNAIEFTPTGPWAVNGQRVIFDTIGHGTHVAGTIAQQTNNALGFAGVSHGATLMPIKACIGELDIEMAIGRDLQAPRVVEQCASSDLAQAIRYAADNGANVLNMSLGQPFPTPVVQAALTYAVSRGVFVAIASGNEALEGNPTNYPAAYASLAGVVAVGATSPRRTRALYSSFGSHLELAAPGGEGGPNGCGAEAEQVWQVAPDPLSLLVFPPRFDRYISYPLCGTSMASPHVAGAAALLYSQGITDPAAIEAALERFAVDMGTPGRDPEFGYGLIDVRAALRGLGLGR